MHEQPCSCDAARHVTENQMDLPEFEALSRVVLLAALYVELTPQGGQANLEAICEVLSWMRGSDALPLGYNEVISATLPLMN